MSYKINYGNEAVSVPAAAIDACGELLQLRLLMLLSYDRGLSDAPNAVLAEQLCCSENEIDEAIQALRAVKLLEPERKLAPSSQTKNLEGEEIARILDSDNSFKQVIDECQNICGAIFTQTEVSKLVSLKTELGFDAETVLLLFFYYSEKLDAVGKKLSVSYIEKSAYSLFNQGVKDLVGLQKYIKETEERNSFNYKIRRLFGIGERAFTKKENRFFEKWGGEWHIAYELIEYAYDITVDSTGKPSLEYMSKILSDWHDSGISSVEEAERSSAEYKKSDKYRAKFKEKNTVKSDEEAKSSFNADEFFEKALKKSYAMMNDGKKGEEA
ncbi:MAG: DnaD domain protein [Clostridia bacterium]|nr:DnaD domain protein [Clostridia bacterium]